MKDEPMTKRDLKRDFIRKLHLACPKFREDVETFERDLSSLEITGDAGEAVAMLAEKSKQLEQKWPRARDFIKWPTFSEWVDGNSRSKVVTDLKALFADLTPLGRAKLEGIEVDPCLLFQKGEIIDLAQETPHGLPIQSLFRQN